MPEQLNISSADTLYELCAAGNAVASSMLELRSWLNDVLESDPASGLAMPTDMCTLLSAVQTRTENDRRKDRLWKIATLSGEASRRLLSNLRNRILREHRLQPIYAIRQVDGHAMQWLSRKPGRTVREKLSERPYLLGVARRSSFDTAENRLLKAFIRKLDELLLGRQKLFCADEKEEILSLQEELHRWLCSDDAEEIGSWGNIPPNNVLLEDRQYRKVWDGWLHLQRIDEDIADDFERREGDSAVVLFWELLTQISSSYGVRLIQQPIVPDVDAPFTLDLAQVIVKGVRPTEKRWLLGKVSSLSQQNSTGFLKASDGKSYFFDRNSFSKGVTFAELSIDSEWAFCIGSNAKGECAINIRRRTEEEPGLVFEARQSDSCIDLQINDKRIHLQIKGDTIVLNGQEPSPWKFHMASLRNSVACVLKKYLGPPELRKETEASKTSDTPVVIDLCSPCPEAVCEGTAPFRLPFMLLCQQWGQGELIDCGSAKALALGDGIKTISMRSLFLNLSEELRDLTSPASFLFAKKLHSQFKGKSVIYIVPDWANDFELENLRKGINFSFAQALPLPRSIATIFAWQASPNFKHSGIHSGDTVLVADAFEDGLCLTPVRAVFDQKLADTLPETAGISWERHPSLVEYGQKHELASELKSRGFIQAEAVASLFGFAGLAHSVGELSIHDGEGWSHITELPAMSFWLKKETVDICRTGKGRLFLLVDKQIRCTPPFLDDTWCMDSPPVEGGLVMLRWQKKTPDVMLWKDHLPKLWIKVSRDGKEEIIHLVKEACIAPQRGKTQVIPVNEIFNLPKGHNFYKFPLCREEGRGDRRFSAELRSQAFPLEKDVRCRLRMSYTYGEDTPYELTFIPLDTELAPFKQLRVEWVEETEEKLWRNLPAPPFPPAESWDDLLHDPKEPLQKSLDRIKRVLSRIEGTLANRYEHEKGIMLFVKVPNHSENVCCLNKQFREPLPEDLALGNPVYLNVNEWKGRLLGANITFHDKFPREIQNWYSLRLSGLLLWKNGRSLSDPDIPVAFRKEIQELTSCASRLLADQGFQKKTMFDFFCSMHKDAPEAVIDILLEYAEKEKEFRQYHRNIAWAIGSGETAWQKQLLKKLLGWMKEDSQPEIVSMSLLALSEALWRHEQLLYALEVQDLSSIADAIPRILHVDLEKLKEGDKKSIGPTINDIDMRNIIGRWLSRHLELILALLRCRSSYSEQVRTIPDTKQTAAFIESLEHITDYLAQTENYSIIRSYLKLNLGQKADAYKNTPDLLYALKLYLTGDTGANTITIEGAQEDTA